MDMYGVVLNVLGVIRSDRSIRKEANGCWKEMQSFDFIFMLHLIHKIIGITDGLCRKFQSKTIDILSAIELVSVTKGFLETVRKDGFGCLLSSVKVFCDKYGIENPSMTDSYMMGTCRSCQQKDSITNDHHYRYDIFTVVLDFQVQEINFRFNDNAIKLLKLCSALDPNYNFKSFEVASICSVAESYYPCDFSSQDIHYLRFQLEIYKVDILHNENFQNLTTISELCQKLFETKKAEDYNMIDRLLCIVLTLHVSTASAERSFSAMKHVKTTIRNKMGDGYLSDSMIMYTEREITHNLDYDLIIDEFADMKNRRVEFGSKSVIVDDLSKEKTR